MLKEVYILTKRNSRGAPVLNCPVSQVQLPYYFSRSQAEYFFDFAETRIPCKPGEEVVLLKGLVNAHALEEVGCLFKLINKADEIADWEVISHKKAGLIA